MDDLISLRDLEAFAALPKLPVANLAQPSKFEPELPDAKRVLAIRTQEHSTPPTLPVTPIENVLIGLEGAPGLVSGSTFWQREQRITPQACAPGGFVTGSLQTTAGLCLMRGMLRRTSPANHTPVVLKSYALMVWSWVKRSSTEQLEEIVALAPPYEAADNEGAPSPLSSGSSSLASTTAYARGSPLPPPSPSRFLSSPAPLEPDYLDEARRVRPRH